MCGFAGIVDFRHNLGPDALERAIGAMTASLAHRGPDAAGAVVEEGLAFGHRRLSIIDVSETGAQPMQSACGRYLLVFNGTVYNFRDLRRELAAKGVKLQGTSDTEVLLEAFAREGHLIFDRIDGMFAVALYDRAKRELVLARDRAGEKPLYYSITEAGVVFASELTSIEACPYAFLDISREAVAAYLAFRYVPAPHTIYGAVQKLEPGTVMRVGSEASPTFRTLARPEYIGPTDPAHLTDTLEATLVQAIKRRLSAADVPIGLFLSGGLDSSLVAALAARHSEVDFTAFTFAFEGDPQSEAEAAAGIARHLNIPHQVIRASDAPIEERLQSLGARLDEPMADRSCLPFEWLCETASQSIKVAVGGDGGDELFLGYSRYFPPPVSPASLKRKHSSFVMEYIKHRLPVVSLETLARTMPGSMALIEKTVETMAKTVECAPKGKELSTMDFHSYLPGAVLAKVDRMSMRHGVEVRTPFLNPDIMALGRSAPMEWLVREGAGKNPLRTLLQRYLPPDLIAGRKQGFGTPAMVFQSEKIGIFSRFKTGMMSMARSGWLSETPVGNKELFDNAASNVNGIWAVLILHQWMAKRGLTP